MTHIISKIERRILKSQEAIKSAFIELISEKNFDQITIKDIADRENVGQRTTYLHYLDKFYLLDMLTEDYMNELSELCGSATDMNYIETELLWFD